MEREKNEGWRGIVQINELHTEKQHKAIYGKIMEKVRNRSYVKQRKNTV